MTLYMSEKRSDLSVQPVGQEAVTRRMLQVEKRLDSLAGELAANQREYETLQDSYRIHLAEHEQLRTKLSILQAATGEDSSPDGERGGA